MRSSILTGISLTLFMLLLVLGAAFLFLFQGRQTVEQQATRVSRDAAGLRQDLAQTETDLAANEATREVTADSLATAEAGAALLEAELTESQSTVDELETRAASIGDELTSANSRVELLEQAQEEALQLPPTVQFIAPQDGVTIVPDEAVDLIVAAADPYGVTAISLVVNESPLDSFAAAGEPLVTYRHAWTATEPGDHVISAVAANTNAVASEPVTLTVRVLDFETRNRAILAQIETNVTGIIDLQLQQPISVTFATSSSPTDEDLQAQVISPPAEIESGDFSSAVAAQVLTLSAFDFVEPDFDLAGAFTLLQSEFGPMVHGPVTSASVVVNEDEALEASVQEQFIHDLAHALQDQNYQLQSLLGGAQDSEAIKAVSALIEGEAELVAALYQEEGYFTVEQIAEIEAGSSQESELPDDFPLSLINEWTFPRIAGLSFARDLYQEGGNSFDLIDDAWADPPLSTEHILHPERYLAGDPPELVTLPTITTTLGQGWELMDEGVLGEFTLRQYLRQQLDETETNTAATGWGGDRYAVYWNESETELAMILRIAWDTVPDSAEFATSYASYATGLLGDSGEIQAADLMCWLGTDAICLTRSENETLVVRAPSVGLALVIAQRIESEQ